MKSSDNFENVQEKVQFLTLKDGKKSKRICQVKHCVRAYREPSVKISAKSVQWFSCTVLPTTTTRTTWNRHSELKAYNPRSFFELCKLFEFSKFWSQTPRFLSLFRPTWHRDTKFIYCPSESQLLFTIKWIFLTEKHFAKICLQFLSMILNKIRELNRRRFT